MARINRDTIVAVFLLLMCGVFIDASFDIRKTSYGQMGSEVWPRVILVLLAILSLAYLGQSLRRPPEEVGAARGLRAWLARYRNALWCYGLFTLFLLALPYIGILAGGSLFVFAILVALGPRGGRDLVFHVLVAGGSVGAMWAVFTYGLRVFLPQGELFAGW